MSEPQNSANMGMVPLTTTEGDAFIDAAVARHAEGGAETGGYSQKVADAFKKIRVTGGGAVMRATGGITGAAMRVARVLHVVLVLDGSGSMLSEVSAVVDGLNDFVSQLADPRNTERNQIELSIWIFSGSDSQLFTVNGVEIVNMPIVNVPKVSISDYRPASSTPLNKTLIASMSAASMRNERLAAGQLIGKRIMNRVATMTYIVVLTDGANTLWKENLGGGKVMDYADSEVRSIVKELQATEQWMFMIIAAGASFTSKEIADNLGFPLYFNVGDGGMRKALGMASKSVGAASVAVLQGGQSASVAMGNQTGNTFLTNP